MTRPGGGAIEPETPVFRDVGEPSVARRRTAGRRVIATIGIDRYRKWRALARAVSDARGVRALFHELGFQDAAPPIHDEQATGRALHTLVTDDLMALEPDDSLVVFFAGHGGTRVQQLDGEQVKLGYLIPFDAARARNQVSTWIDLGDWLRRIAVLPPRHILVIIDACHSGIALDPVFRWRSDSAADNVPLAALHTRRSRRIITSALDDQLALDNGPVHGHSLFTGCLIEALRGRLPADHGVTTGSAIGLWLQERVRTYPRSRQTPDFGAFEFDDRGEMAIPVLVACVAAGAEQTPAVRTVHIPPSATHAGGTADSGVAQAGAAHAARWSSEESRQWLVRIATGGQRWTLLAILFWIAFLIIALNR